MGWFRKAFFLALVLLLLVTGLWLVVVNNQPLSLNLLFVATPSVNAGFVVLASFAAGALVGILVGLNLFTMLRLNSQVFRLKRERKQLQAELDGRRQSL